MLSRYSESDDFKAFEFYVFRLQSNMACENRSCDLNSAERTTRTMSYQSKFESSGVDKLSRLRRKTVENFQDVSS